MADFTPKTSEEILNDAINYLYLNTNISDFNVGSVIRTILESMALEDANQYYQMYNLLNAFFLQNVTGEALDDRAADYDVARKPATSSGGVVLFLDTNLQRSFLTADVAAGATILYVEDVSVFGAAPFLVQLGEGGNVEQVRITAADVATGSLTIDAAAAAPFNQTTYAHSSATTGIDEVDNRSSLVCLYNASSADRLIASGTTMRAQPTNVTFEVECITTEVGLQQQGYFASDPVAVRSTAVGSTTNIPAKSLNQIVGGMPYAGASVVNTAGITGGREAESDAEFRTRIRNTISSLPAATKIALITNLLTTTDPVTSAIVTRASIVEDFEKDLVYAYVDDSSSSGIANSESRLAEDTLAVVAAAGATSVVLNSVDGFDSTTLSNASYIIFNPLGSPFVTQYGSLLPALNTLDQIPNTHPGYAAGTTVSLCEPVETSSLDKRKYYQLDNAPLGDDLLRLYLVNGAKLGEATLLVPLANGACSTGTEDYVVNEALGQIEFLTGKVPVAGSAIYAIYESYTNLLKESQKVVDGDLLDPVNYPGVRSAGVKVLVRPAQRTPVDVVLDITVDNDQTDLDTASFFSKQLVVSYINNLGIGQDVILAELIDSVMGVTGVINVHIMQPQADVTINEDRAPYADSVLIV
jgi:uncharacterized phage protein gp47/JayE